MAGATMGQWSWPMGNRKHPDEWYCNADRRQNADGQRPAPGETPPRCNQPSGFGTDHVGAGRCKFHGGSTAQHQAAAVEVLVQRQFRAFLAEHGTPASDDPVAAITRILGETAAWYDFMRQLIGELSTADWESKGPQGSVQLSIYIATFERAQERAARLLMDFVRLGIEERLARVTELQGRAIASVLLGALADLGLGERAEEATAAVGRRLELVTGGKGAG